MKKKRKKENLTEAAVYDATYEAIRQFGWIIPTDEASVADAEARMANIIKKLPSELQDLSSPTASGRTVKGKLMPLWDPSVLSEPMARAARRGGTISPEVEEIMKRDREIAERKLRDHIKSKGINEETNDK